MAGAPQIGQMRSEVSRLEGQKSAVEGQRASIRQAISELRSKKSEIDGNIADLRGKLAGNLPPQIQVQIKERLSMLVNARKNISTQLGSLSEKLAQTSEAIQGIGMGISARKKALERIAGQMTRMPFNNRESGRKKG